LINNYKRYHELDSLRGLAAIAVFASHAMGLTADANYYILTLNHSPVHMFWDGSAAVIFFFVLSGFVISLPFVNDAAERVEIIPFIIKRVFRIYPAYILAILLSVGLKYYWFQQITVSNLSEWIKSFWTLPISSKNVLDHIVMVGPSFDSNLIDPVIWSLIYEMKVSLIFPFILFVYGITKSIKSIYLILFASVVLSILLDKFILLTISLFLIGAVLAKHRDLLINKLSTANLAIKILIACIGVFFYSVRFCIPSLQSNEIILNYTVGMGACVIMVLGLAIHQMSNFLAIRIIKLMGKISYSFYLLHLPVLITCTSILIKHTSSLLLITAISLFGSIIISYTIYVTIEIPFISWGRTVGLYFNKMTATTLNYKNNGKRDTI
jgi:peptidoglycan/LPS O-acetylase OafA/YrhL